jgi:hypothetical protein
MYLRRAQNILEVSIRTIFNIARHWHSIICHQLQHFQIAFLFQILKTMQRNTILKKLSKKLLKLMSHGQLFLLIANRIYPGQI